MPLRAEEGQYGSGTVSGGGFGNKTKPDISPESDDRKDDAVRFGTAENTDPYSGGHPHHGSGSTGGAGFGNKTSDGFGNGTCGDSVAGCLFSARGTACLRHHRLEMQVQSAHPHQGCSVQ